MELKKLILSILNETLSDITNVSDNYYHGSRYKFDTFNNDVKDSSKKTGGDEYGYGTYLTKDKNLATHYARGGYVYTTNITDNLNFLSDERKVSKNNLTKIKNIIYQYDFLNSDNERMTDSHKDFIMDNIIDGHKNGRDLYIKILRKFAIPDKKLSSLMDKNGINGLIGNDGKEYVIFNAANITIIDIESL